MNDAREPLHQPPNPEDLRRAPPAGPDCARVRGWLRDYVDGDLESFRVRELDEHVHRCRACAIELSRSEHELLRVKQVFRELRVGQAVLPPDFAQRVVERLVVDETSLVSADTLGAAVRAHAAGAADREDHDGGRAAGREANVPGTGRRRGLRPGVVLVAALAMLLAVGGGLELMRGPGRGPDHSARLFLLKADGAYHEHTQLREGNSLGERQTLSVRAGGGAELAWQDRSTNRPQPAAKLHLRGDGEVRLENGQPLLVDGTLDVESNRDVSIPLGDGSRIDLGIGSYTIAVQNGFDPQNPLFAAPADLYVTVEVREGEEASIARAGFAPAVVLAGHIGAYQGSRDTTITASGGIAGRNDSDNDSAERDVVPSAPALRSLLHFQVRQQGGMALPEADVLFTFVTGGAVTPNSRISGTDGTILCETGDPIDSAFLIARVLPPPDRPDLGMVAPDAVPLVRQGVHASVPPITVAPSVPFFGSVRDELGLPLPGVQVLPCIVDEVFGAVLPLHGSHRVSDAGGGFRLDGLPGRLPAQQGLYLVLSHPQFSTAVMPIPARAAPGADVPFPPLAMEPRRSIRVHGLAPHQTVQVVEELPNLPRGAAVRRLLRTADGAGTLPGHLQVGAGELWVRDVQTDLVRPLQQDGWVNVQSYRPSPAAAEPWSLRFRGVTAVPNSDLEIVSSFRHLHAFPPGALGDANRTVSVLDIAGNPIGNVQVFVTAGLTPAGMAMPRFLGFTQPNGLLGWNDIGGTHLVLIGPDGRVATEELAQGVAGNHTVEIPQCGRVVLPAARRPDPTEPQVVAMRFERVEADPELRGPAALRFASAANDWTVGDLQPGEYRVVIGGVAVPVNVPAGGWIELP